MHAMQTSHIPEIPHMVEHIEQRAEKLYNTYRNKHPHNTPALNVQQLTYDLGGKIWVNPDVNRLLKHPRTRHQRLRPQSRNPTMGKHKLHLIHPLPNPPRTKNQNHRKRIHQVSPSPQPRAPIPTCSQQQKPPSHQIVTIKHQAPIKNAKQTGSPPPYSCPKHHSPTTGKTPPTEILSNYQSCSKPA